MTDAVGPPPSAPAAPPSLPGAGSGEAALRKAAQQFEAVFLRQMIGSMRSASIGEGLLDNDATTQFRDMSDAKLADQMAGKGALHIADILVKQYGARLAVKGSEGAGK